ncbi:efflux RND transporter periplasmic adaptor subunit [Thioclava atlantica]|uniref:RND family efflux transporter MFP subunit n=1 Tax=Thioclava atlantica TaxID=1317124 RepID=A0A085TSL9_9RHOB|nr:efflux RND transporter periplasmic adaptor subunit [Thioclava atlantica]KFE33716.1 RND family efflux transporter MFP subunit [Thioclava atlantica]
MTPKPRTRWLIPILVALITAGALAALFWPQPQPVDTGIVSRGPMKLVIEDDGRTRVNEAFTVSAPVSGRLERLDIHVGDPVVKGETVVARMRPALPAVLDARSRAQAEAALAEAKAALSAAEGDYRAAVAKRAQAEADLARSQRLALSGTISQSVLDRDQVTADYAEAQEAAAKAAIAMREAAVASAQSVLQNDAAASNGEAADAIPLYAPASGTVLQILRESETVLAAGTPIMEIGNISDGLEVVADLLSRDAVRVRVGDPVEITDWGGPNVLEGKVERIDPSGVTKVSALGVEEQRVGVVIGFTGDPARREGLGHGFQVTVGIVVWQAQDALRVPSSALFRRGSGWAVFRVKDGRAHEIPVEIGTDNGQVAEVTSGLSEGDQVVLYPVEGLADGARVAPRIAS